jgi:hypothetical protein
MDRMLDVNTRRLLAHYRAWPRDKALDVIARRARASGRVVTQLLSGARVPERTAA